VAQTGSASASSTYGGQAQYAPSRAIDGSNGTSWFSAGGGSATFVWQGTRNDFLDRITLVSNAGHADPAVRNGFGFNLVGVFVYDMSGAFVFSTSTSLPPGGNWAPITLNLKVVGARIQLNFSGADDPTCGGFGELQIVALR
jgi:hypothetical protein